MVDETERIFSSTLLTWCVLNVRDAGELLRWCKAPRLCLCMCRSSSTHQNSMKIKTIYGSNREARAPVILNAKFSM